MSTNDTVLLLASGAAGVRPDAVVFAAAVREVCADLGRQILADAEGATKEIAIDVVRAADVADAVEVGRCVARSPLVKCAVYGEDPNWGRILAAVGTTSAAFEPEHLAVAVNGVWVCRDGGAGEDRSLVDMSGRQVRIRIDLGAGDAEATIWTNDLTAEYVSINADYPT
jgi:glutamate N-acetyltransferase/amino-acid N-acetyltransferase